MAATIDMKTMRYINLFAKISRVPTTKCFTYNGQIIFAVPKAKVSAAIGKGAVNVKKLKSVIGKKVKVVAMPGTEDKEGIRQFIVDVVDPIEFSKADIKENSITINAGRQSKAALIGRNRMREKELSEVLKNFFHITQFKIA